MLKACIALALLSGASAFTSPASASVRRAVVRQAEPETPTPTKVYSGEGGAEVNLVGTPVSITGALSDLDDVAQKQGIPNFIYDPLNLAQAEYFGESNAATIGFIRQAELKHGRIAMAGFVGFLVHAQGITWPFPMTLDGAKWPTLQEAGSVPALWDLIPEGGKWQIILAIGILEWWDEYQFEPEKNPSKPKHYMRGGRPGDYPPFFGEGKNFLPLNLYDPFGAFKKMTPEQAEKRRVIEVNNGRLAMIGLFSLLASSKLDGSVPLLTGVLPAYDGKIMAPFEANFHLF
jgi:hypothetical protein